MSFSAFSKEFTANMYTSVENQFITKYLPWADGDAVRAYLYGLYLCSCKEEFDAVSAAKLLKLDYRKLIEIFVFWEECGLVHILSREPLFVEYLPVNAAVGRPKPIRAEKYTEFNRELLHRLQRAGKDFKPYEMQKILEFLENNQMEQQAFLLVTEYCIKKDGEKVSFAHVMNKAKKLASEHKYTYEQVERDLADFNLHERELSKIFTLLGIYRKPQENDYDFLDKWLDWGIDPGAVLECAGALKKGTLSTLDALMTELHEKGLYTKIEAKEYLSRREELANVVFAVARKLGIKIQNPRAYVEEYAEKWLERGYESESLLLVANLSFRLRYGFAEMGTLLDSLYLEGIVDETGVKQYCATRDKQFKLLQSIQATCGVVKKTQSALDMISVWQSWNFSDAMIIEAAKRSASAAAPLSYMNKLLSEWKRTDVFVPTAIPEKTLSPARIAPSKQDFRSEAAIAADKRTDREHHYAVLRQNAITAAENARIRAQQDPTFALADSELKKGEIELAKAEVFAPQTIPAIQEKLEASRRMRATALLQLGVSDEDFEPKFTCKKCSDTGFLPDGRACDCYSALI